MKMIGSRWLRIIGVAALTVVVIVGSAISWRLLDRDSEISAPDVAPSPDLVARGEYLARAADCGACHKAPGGKPFAGGLPFKLPFGTIYSTNITSDPETGIGTWSDDDFVRALHRGIAVPISIRRFLTHHIVGLAAMTQSQSKLISSAFRPCIWRRRPTAFLSPSINAGLWHSGIWPSSMRIAFEKLRAFPLGKTVAPTLRQSSVIAASAIRPATSPSRWTMAGSSPAPCSKAGTPTISLPTRDPGSVAGRTSNSQTISRLAMAMGEGQQQARWVKRWLTVSNI